MPARTETAAGEESKSRDRSRTKNRAEHHAELPLGLAHQRMREQSLAEQHAKQVGDLDAYSLAEFCRRHSISLQLFYKLVTQGIAPVTFRVGTRVLVSKESAARWRAERERASSTAEAKGQPNAV